MRACMFMCGWLTDKSVDMYGAHGPCVCLLWKVNRKKGTRVTAMGKPFQPLPLIPYQCCYLLNAQSTPHIIVLSTGLPAATKSRLEMILWWLRGKAVGYLVRYSGKTPLVAPLETKILILCVRERKINRLLCYTSVYYHILQCIRYFLIQHYPLLFLPDLHFPSPALIQPFMLVF